MFAVKEQDSISKQIEELLNILKALELIFDLKNEDSLKLISCFGFVIVKSNGDYDNKDYLKELDKIQQESLSQDVYGILKSIIKEQRVLCLSKISSF